MFLIRFVRAKKLNARQKLFQTIPNKGMTVWYGYNVHICRKRTSFPAGLIYAFTACQPPDRKIVLRRPSRSRIRRGLADVAVRRHCRPTWKEYSDAAPSLPTYIAVTDARLLSKLHHAAVSRSVGGAAEKASSFALSCSSPERCCLACLLRSGA